MTPFELIEEVLKSVDEKEVFITCACAVDSLKHNNKIVLPFLLVPKYIVLALYFFILHISTSIT